MKKIKDKIIRLAIHCVLFGSCIGIFLAVLIFPGINIDKTSLRILFIGMWIMGKGTMSF